MSSIEVILFNVAKQFSIYVSFVIIISGLICNILNIAVFTQLTIFRGKNSSFYLTTESIVNCFQISLILTFRTFVYAFAYDPTQTSIVWCKLKPLIAQACAIISMTTVCFAAIDQYLSTSYHVQIRQLSTLKLAYRLISILICLTLLHGIPFLIFITILPIVGCTSSNRVFATYLAFVHYCFLIGILPITISSLFAILAYFNVRHLIRHQITIARRKLDRQLTAMILVGVCLLTITVLPFTAFQIYQYKASSVLKSSLQIAIEQLISAITYSILSCNYSASFWVFLISSTKFRRQVKYFLFKKLWRKFRLETNTRNITPRYNQVNPESNISSHRDILSK